MIISRGHSMFRPILQKIYRALNSIHFINRYFDKRRINFILNMCYSVLENHVRTGSHFLHDSSELAYETEKNFRPIDLQSLMYKINYYQQNGKECGNKLIHKS